MRSYRMRTSCSRSATVLTWMASICVGVCLIGLITSVQSGPVYERARRMISNGEETSEAMVSAKARNQTNPNKDVCLMEGHTIPRRLVSCPTKPGCRAIQKEGECCPEYQCECERDGKLYENGEKIMDPETPCRVCYCQGGEFTCNNVTCYNRNDCKPRYTPGRCCPEYDNCPPLDTTKSDHNENNSSDNTEEEGKPTTSTTSATSPAPLMIEATSSSSSSSSPSNSAVSNDNPLGIKIKEITKPEEIRITDEKPKTVIKVGSTSTTTTSTTTVSPTVESSSSSSAPSSSTDETELFAEGSSSASSSPTPMTSETSTYDQFNKTDDPFELGDEFDQELVNGTDTNKNVREAGEGAFEINGLDEDPMGEMESEKEEAFDDTRSMFMSSTESTMVRMDGQEQHTDIKQVIIVDHNGASKQFTIIGSSDLQFGGRSPDEEIDFHGGGGGGGSSPSSTPGYIDDMGSGEEEEAFRSFNDSTATTTTTSEVSDMEGKASTNSEVFVKPNHMYEGSTPVDDATTEAWEGSGTPLSTTVSSSVSVLNSSELNSSEEMDFVNATNWDSDEAPVVDHSESTVTVDTPLDTDFNPEYPKLPYDDFSIHAEEEHPEDQLFVHSSTAKPSLKNYADIVERSPGEPHLIPEWERDTNGTEKENLGEVIGEEEEEPFDPMEFEKKNKKHQSDTTSEEETNLVLGNGQEKGSAEPTTVNSLRFDIGGISLQDDMMMENSTEERRSSPSPKDDVESLKMREETVLLPGEETQEMVGRSVLARRRKIGDGSGREMSLWDLF